MGLGGCEMIVHGHNIPRLNKDLGQKMLCCPPLMHRKNIVESQNLFYGLSQLVKTFTSCISVIRDHHSRQLVVTHRISSAIGQHINEDISGAEGKSVVPTFLNGF